MLYAFQDENKNLKLESNNEKYGFTRDTIRLDTGLYTKNLDLIKLDLSDFRIMTAIASGKYFDINLNKYIADFDIVVLDNSHKVIANRAKEDKSIRFYNNFQNLDSLQIEFTAIDSLDEVISDTLYVKFAESRRKKDDFTITVLPDKNASIESKTEFKLHFNKPVIKTNTDSIYIQFDTTAINAVHDTIFIWNKFRDELSFTVEIDQVQADTILSRRNRLAQMKKDSLLQEQTNAPQLKQQIKKNQKEDEPKINKGLQLYFGLGAFLSSEQDTSKAFGFNYKFIEPEEKGIQEVNVQTDYPGFIIQLTDENFRIIEEVQNEQKIIFKNIDPGNYKIRVLIDENNDGTWSPGNMKKQIEPEPVYIYPEVLVIRADWRTTLDLTF